jgi:hypothetical protein
VTRNDDFDDVGVRDLPSILEISGEGGHRTIGVIYQKLGDFVYISRDNFGFVSLEVHHDVDVDIGNSLGNAVGAAGAIGAGHNTICTEGLGGGDDSLVVGGYYYLSR